MVETKMLTIEERICNLEIVVNHIADLMNMILKVQKAEGDTVQSLVQHMRSIIVIPNYRYTN